MAPPSCHPTNYNTLRQTSDAIFASITPNKSATNLENLLKHSKNSVFYNVLFHAMWNGGYNVMLQNPFENIALNVLLPN